MQRIPIQWSNVRAELFLLALCIVVVTVAHAGIALLLGAAFAVIPRPRLRLDLQPLTSWSLQTGIILVGFSMPLSQLLERGKADALPIVSFVLVTLCLGVLFGRLLRNPLRQSLLLASGTAICGGTAVAGLAPILRTPTRMTAEVLLVIFLFNAVALWLFPFLGERLSLSDEAYGLWCALAIHDTSSVVGAAASKSDIALQTATAAKLLRALMLIPLLLVMAVLRGGTDGVRFPRFIVVFVLASACNYLVVLPYWVAEVAASMSRALFCLALVFIGAAMEPGMLRQLNIRLVVQGILLWLFVTGTSLLWIVE